jgi:hypothetical protein
MSSCTRSSPHPGPNDHIRLAAGDEDGWSSAARGPGVSGFPGGRDIWLGILLGVVVLSLVSQVILYTGYLQLSRELREQKDIVKKLQQKEEHVLFKDFKHHEHGNLATQSANGEKIGDFGSGSKTGSQFGSPRGDSQVSS